MNSIDFAKTKLVVDVCNYIADKRQHLLEDLVAYTEDPVRYKRRLRLLRQLAQYESSIIQKIEEFNADGNSDVYSFDTMGNFKDEIDLVASTNT